MEKKVYFTNSKGNKLSGIFSNNSQDKTKLIIIVVHGFTSHMNSKSYTKIIDDLNKNHISSFRFDLYAHGESEGQFEKLTTSEAVDDVLNAINYLKRLGYLKIGLLGGSFGGISSIIAASKSKDIILLALKSPVVNFKEKYEMIDGQSMLEDWKKKGLRHIIKGNKVFKLNYTFFEDSLKNDGYKAATHIIIPTFIVHGDQDESVPLKQSIKLAKIIPKCRLEIIKGADHSYTNPDHFKKMAELISGFIIKHV